MKRIESDNIIQNKSFQFSLHVIVLFKKIHASKQYVISNQILRSGTSIGANIEEALAAESKKDFLHKMNIALKEARETKYWLRLIKYGEIELVEDSLFIECDEILSILTSIVKSTKISLNIK